MLQDVMLGLEFKDKMMVLKPRLYANEGFLFSGASDSMIKHD